MSKKVKLNFSFGYFKKGTIVSLETTVAKTLIADGKAFAVKESKPKNKNKAIKSPPINKMIKE